MRSRDIASAVIISRVVLPPNTPPAETPMSDVMYAHALPGMDTPHNKLSWIKGEVSWKDVKAQAGTYKVSLSYASPGDPGGEFTVAIGDNELKGETRPTGGFSRYDNVAIGSVG